MSSKSYRTNQNLDVAEFIAHITQQMNSDEPITSGIYFRTGRPTTVAETAKFIDESLQMVQDHPEWVAFTETETYRELGIILGMHQTGNSANLLHRRRREISVAAMTKKAWEGSRHKLAFVGPETDLHGNVSLALFTTTPAQIQASLAPETNAELLQEA